MRGLAKIATAAALASLLGISTGALASTGHPRGALRGHARDGAAQSSGKLKDSDGERSKAARFDGGVHKASAAQIAAYPVLGRRQARARRVLGSRKVLHALYAPQSQYAANPSLGREVVANSVGSAVLVPGEGAICIAAFAQVLGESGYCAPEARAESEGLGVYGDIDDQRYVLVGVLPAGSSDLRILSEAGKTEPAALSSADGYAIEASTRPAALLWTAAGGSQRSRTLPDPPAATPEA